MKKKILFICYNNLEKGGIQNILMNIVRSLSDIITFDIVCLDARKAFYDNEFEKYGGKIFRLGKYDGNSTKHARLDYYIRGNYLYRNVKKILKNNGPYECIHCNNALESGLCLKAAYECGVPIRIAHSHTVFDGSGNVLRRIYFKSYRKLIHKYATQLIGCSVQACKSLFLCNDVNVIPNSIDLSKFQYRPYNNENLKLIQIGTFSENKNQMFSLQVLKEIVSRNINATLVFVGRTNSHHSQMYFEKLNMFIRENKLNEYIIFLPGESDVSSCLAESSYLIFPSIKEGFGIVPIEAQGVGLRCFLSDSVPRELDCGGCVFVSLGDDVKKWADVIIKDYCNTRGVHNRYDCSRYSIETIMKEYRKIYGIE